MKREVARKAHRAHRTGFASLARLAPALAAAALLAGAAPPPPWAISPARPAACAYCRMPVESRDFGGEIRTTDGRRQRYDAVECMAAAVLTDSVPPRAIRAMTATDHAAPHRALDARRAVFLRSAALHSPMGLDVSAHAGAAAARAAQRRHAGEILDWKGVLALVNHLWFRDQLDVARHARPPGPGGK